MDYRVGEVTCFPILETVPFWILDILGRSYNKPYSVLWLGTRDGLASDRCKRQWSGQYGPVGEILWPLVFLDLYTD